MSELDPIELALQNLSGANVADQYEGVLTERPYDLTTREQKINKAIEEERQRKRRAGETVFGLSDPMKTLESWCMISTLNHQGLEHMRYTSQMKITGIKNIYFNNKIQINLTNRINPFKFIIQKQKNKQNNPKIKNTNFR